MQIEDDKVKLKLLNTDSQVLTVERIAVSWPAALGQLKKVKFGGDTLVEQFIDPDSMTMDSFEGLSTSGR